MARKPMVTRVIPSTIATVFCVDMLTRVPEDREYVLPRTYKSDSDILKAICDAYDVSKVKPVEVISTKIVRKRYKQTEAHFIANADDVDEITDEEITE